MNTSYNKYPRSEFDIYTMFFFKNGSTKNSMYPRVFYTMNCRKNVLNIKINPGFFFWKLKIEPFFNTIFYIIYLYVYIFTLVSLLLPCIIILPAWAKSYPLCRFRLRLRCRLPKTRLKFSDLRTIDWPKATSER